MLLRVRTCGISTDFLPLPGILFCTSESSAADAPLRLPGSRKYLYVAIDRIALHHGDNFVVRFVVVNHAESRQSVALPR